MHPVVWADSGITQWSDLKDKRIFVGPPAGAANSQSTGMVESASNLKADADYEPVKLPWGQATQSFQDDTALGVLNKTAIRPFFSFVFFRPLGP